jgi:isoquinoline 1-oxidoreductase beta subunit
VIADELEADWDRIELLQALGDAKYGDQNTDGSTSIRKHFDLLRTAGASAREMLVAAAAMEWGVPATELVARNHAVHHEASGRSAVYGDLVASAAELDVPEDVTFKDPADYRYIGKSMDLVDGVAMTTGTGIYGTDTVLPGMLYASIERCPVYGGTVKSVDDTGALKVGGVENVIKMPNVTSPQPARRCRSAGEQYLVGGAGAQGAGGGMGYRPECRVRLGKLPTTACRYVAQNGAAGGRGDDARGR